MTLKKAILIILFFINFSVSATEEVDSLKMELRKATDSMVVADLCFAIYKKYTFDIKREVNQTPEYLFRALKIYETTTRFGKLADVYNALGGYYYNRKLMNLARENWVKGSNYYLKSGDSLGVAKSFNNLSLTFQYSDEAKVNYLRQSIGVLNQIGDSTILGSAYNNLADYYRAKKQNDKAEKYLKLSIKVAENIGKISTQQAGYLDLGLVKKEQGMIDDAITCIEKSLTFNAIRSTDPNVLNAFKALTELYFSQENYDKAFHFQKLWMNAKDSLYNQSINEKLLSLTSEYETEKKELTIKAQQSEINLLEAENQLKNQWLVVGGLSILSFFLLSIYGNRGNSHERKRTFKKPLLRTLLAAWKGKENVFQVNFMTV